ncbi:MAG: hypothetical protein JW889_03400 [Verrucomicrobia bacterium]|nr:hypothetical protein [Verrucomicrobiota bacterium]
MLFDAATGNVPYTIGHVAEFCVFCRRIQPFIVKSVKEMTFVLFMPVAVGKELSRTRRCLGCGAWRRLDAFSYSTPAVLAGASICELIAQTNPGLCEEHAERLALEERLQASPAKLSADERRRLIAEPFHEASRILDDRLRCRRSLRLPGWLALLGAILLGFVYLVVGPIGRPPSQRVSWLSILFAALTAGAGIAAFVLLCFPVRLYMRTLTRLIARSLAPLQPNRAELVATLDTLRERNHRLARDLRPEWIMEAMLPLGDEASGQPH